MVCVRTILAFLLALAMASTAGCFSSHPKDIEAFLKPDQVGVTAKSYILAPPDEIEIRCSRVPELHEQRQQIRPDGKVSFEGLGEVEAAGKTPDQLAAVLNEKAAALYKLPNDKAIDVRIVVFRSKVFYVLGQVYVPGPKEYTGRDSVLYALSLAQPNPMAWVERIQIIRPSPDKRIKPKIFEINLDRMIAHGDMSKNVLLQEGDVIYVPPTVLAGIALKVEEFVRPIGRAFSTVNIVSGPQSAGGQR